MHEFTRSTQFTDTKSPKKVEEAFFESDIRQGCALAPTLSNTSIK